MATITINDSEKSTENFFKREYKSIIAAYDECIKDFKSLSRNNPTEEDFNLCSLKLRSVEKRHKNLDRRYAEAFV